MEEAAEKARPGFKPANLTKWKAKKRNMANDGLMQPSKVAREMTKDEIFKNHVHCTAAKKSELESLKSTEICNIEVFDESRHTHPVTGRCAMAWKSVRDVDIPKWQNGPRYDSQGQRRAKARYVLIGFQDCHLNTDTGKYKIDSPAGSRLAFHAVVSAPVPNGWGVKSCDASTAFFTRSAIWSVKMVTGQYK